MKKFSFFVKHLGPNQVSYLLHKNIPLFIKNNPEYDITVFCETHFKHCYMNDFCILPSSELWGYRDACISIGFEIGEKLLQVQTIKRKFHFLMDFDWALQLFNSRRVEALYQNKDMSFLTRNEDYRQALLNAWDVESKIVGDLDVSAISQII